MATLPLSGMSRIDKLPMDLYAQDPTESRRARERRGLVIAVGDDVATSYNLQTALITSINLGAKCFSGNVQVHASPSIWHAPALGRLSTSTTLGEAMREFGARPLDDEALLELKHLILGSARALRESVRITYDGWNVAVGPAAEQPRLNERPYCALASVAAAAIGVGELFSELMRLSIEACRRCVAVSLWLPTQPITDAGSEGEPISEFPSHLALYGLGHLGQAYLWSIVSLPLSAPEHMTLLLCDDDKVEEPNVETGALLRPNPPIELKTRMAAEWLKRRGFPETRLVERRIDAYFHWHDEHMRIALSGFDDNRARRWLASSNFDLILDSGLGGKAGNFDSIAFRAWPNARTAEELWPVEKLTEENPDNTSPEECGRILVNDVSVAVPFVGAMAACVVVAEMIKRIAQGPVFDEMRLRVCSLSSASPSGKIVDSPLMRGLSTQTLNAL